MVLVHLLVKWVWYLSLWILLRLTGRPNNDSELKGVNETGTLVTLQLGERGWAGNNANLKKARIRNEFKRSRWKVWLRVKRCRRLFINDWSDFIIILLLPHPGLNSVRTAGTSQVSCSASIFTLLLRTLCTRANQTIWRWKIDPHSQPIQAKCVWLCL